jgi:PKD repeat protein
MVTTGNYDVVAELSQAVLQQILHAAWKNGSPIPQNITISPGTQFGPYQVEDGTAQISDNGLALDLVPNANSVKITLPTTFNIQLQNPPIPTLALFNIAANIFVTVPLGIMPGSTVNVGAILDGLSRNNVAVTLTSIDPDIQNVSLSMISDYIHQKFTDGTITTTSTIKDYTVGIYKTDVYWMLYDDLNDATHQIDVTQPSPNQVLLSIPIYLRLSNMTANGIPVPSPVGAVARILVQMPLETGSGYVKADVTSPSTTVQVADLGPSSDPIEMANYNIDSSVGGAFFTNTLKSQIILVAQQTLQSLGDITVFTPTDDQIATFIGDQVYAALLGRCDIGLWTPQIPSNAQITVTDVVPKVLSDCLALCINDRGGGDPNAITSFIPAGLSCAINVNGDKIIELINGQIAQSYPSLPGTPAQLSNIDGHPGTLNSLTPSLKDGAIHFDGNATVNDITACNFSVDADFWADIGLQWQDDGNGNQILTANVINQNVDPHESGWAWVIGALTGGLIGVIIVAIVEKIVNDIAESVGGQIIQNNVSNQTVVVAPWPQDLEGIGQVDTAFENPIDIYSDSVLFPDFYIVNPIYASTSVASALANGPYAVAGSSPLQLTGGPTTPSTSYEWDLGDGTKVAGQTVSHTYAKHGTYVSKFRTDVQQPGGTVSRQFTKVIARSVTPIVNVAGDMTVNEGQEVDYSVVFTDGEWDSTHKAIFNFGDNQLPAEAVINEKPGPPNCQGTATVKHAYCRADVFTVNVQVINEDLSIGQASFKVTVRNLPPKVEACEDVYAYPCAPITLVAKFTDPGWCEKHTGKWYFGDCIDTQMAVIREINAPPEGRGIATAAHTYNRLGTYVAECTVTDEYGASGWDKTFVRVVDLLNHGFEEGFHSTHIGVVANRWIPYKSKTQEPPAGSATVTYSMAENPESLTFDGEEFIVHGGQRSQKIIGAKVIGGIYQQVGANINWDYQFSVWHNENGKCKCRLGIDPNGGIDPTSSSVVWAEGSDEQNWASLAVRVTAKSRLITVYLEAQFETTAKAYFDDAQLIPYPCILKMPPFWIIPSSDQKCAEWSDAESQELGKLYEKNGFIFRSSMPMQIVRSGIPANKGKLVIDPNMIVQLPFLAEKVIAQVVRLTTPITLTAIGENGGVIAKAIVSNKGELNSVELKGDGEAISFVRFMTDEQRNLLISLCAFPLKLEKITGGP